MKTILLQFKQNSHNIKPQKYKVEAEYDTHLVVVTSYSKGDVTRMTLITLADGSYRNEHGCEFVAVKQDRRPKPYAIDAREEGRGPANITKFATLLEVQAYVRARWQGSEYIDSPTSFHNDYCRFLLKNCSLYDLGHRGSTASTSDEFWDWTWETL